MRSGLKDGRVAGSGINLAMYEKEETYRDKKVKNVRFPSDYNKDYIHEITYYYMSPEEIERRYGNSSC